MDDEIGGTVRRGVLVLADGAAETRVMFDDTVPIDPVLGSASLLETPSGREARADIFEGYVDDARSFMSRPCWGPRPSEPAGTGLAPHPVTNSASSTGEPSSFSRRSGLTAPC